jgi:hypothetical protein
MPYKDPEKARQYRVEHYQKNKARYRELGRRWKEEHREEHLAQQAEYRAENRERLRAFQDVYRAANREQINAKRREIGSAFPSRNPEARVQERLKRQDKIHAYSLDYYAQNRALVIEKSAEWREKNPERVRANKARWANNHPDAVRAGRHRRRTRRRNLPDTFTAQDSQRMMQYWHYACAVCGTQEGFAWTLALDHWIPLADPASPGHVASNVVPLCHTTRAGYSSCNLSKSDTDAHAWLLKRVGARRAKKIEAAIAAYFAWVQTPHAPGPPNS